MNPYHRNAEGNPEFAESWVSFLDVLGTSDIAGSPDAERYLIQFDKAIANARETTTDTLANPWFLASWFSDNLAIGSPIKPGYGQGEPELGTFLNVISTVQLFLALEGFFTRGGLTLGPFFMDENISFGPALVEAVAIEKVAQFPRVLVGPTAMEQVRVHLGFYRNHPEGAPHNSDLWVDQHGGVFINYLDAVRNFVGESVREAQVFVENHRDRIVEGLSTYRDIPSIWQKYAWAADYHNAFCAAHALEDCTVPSQSTENVFCGVGEWNSM